MRRSRFLFSLSHAVRSVPALLRIPLLAFGFFTVPALSAQTRPPQQTSTTGPNLNGVNDVLDGRLTLLEQTDAAILITHSTNGSAPTDLQGSLLPFNSSNSNLNAQAPVNLAYQSGFSYNRQNLIDAGASGRYFNNGNDVVFSTGVSNNCGTSNPTFSQGWSYTYYNPATGSNQLNCLPHEIYPNGNVIATKTVMGNFQGNNLVEPLFFLQSQFAFQNSVPGEVLSQMNIVTAPDINKTDQINTTGGQAPWAHDTQPNVSYGVADCPNTSWPLANTLVTGDINGDGIDEIAMLLSDYKTVALFKVTQTNFTPTLYSCVTLPKAVLQGTLAAGRFSNTGQVSLAAVGHTDDGNTQSKNITVELIDTTVSPAAVYVTTHDVTNPYYYPGFGPVLAKAAPINNWNSATAEQLVIGSSFYDNSWIVLDVGSFDLQQQHTFHVLSENGYTGCLFGMEVGNFNHQSSTSTLPGNSDPTLQIGLLQSTYGESECIAPFANGSLHLIVQNVNVPPAAQQNPLSSFPPTSNLFSVASDVVPDVGSYDTTQSIQLLSGDFQGRSLRLGAPEKVVIKGHLRPDFILGIPPMHVDWIDPAYLNTQQTNHCEASTQLPDKKQCVLNLSVLPYPTSGGVNPAFNSFYTVSETSTSTEQHTSTTSWGIAGKATLDDKITFGEVGVLTGSIGVKAFASNAYSNVSSKFDSTYQQTSQSLSSKTGFDDVVYFTSETQNIFSYPVLGQKDSKGNEIYVLYSVPSEATSAVMDGSTQQWYQPIHEIGNVLSYPSSQAALQSEVNPNSLSLQAQTVCSAPNSSQGVSRIGWTNSTKSSTKAGWNDSFSAGETATTSATVTASALTGGAGGKIKASISVSGSGAWGKLNDSITETNTSQAFVITAPEFDKILASTTGYAYKGFVYGVTPATPADQTPDSLLKPGLDIKTSGPLYTSFIANPFQEGSDLQCGQPGSNWWRAVYTRPDVGLNHPDRWDVSMANVATFNFMQANRPATEQAFFHMKGLYITNSDASSDDAPVSTISSVDSGQKVKISARIYNFSPVATNAAVPASTVHVRIYGQKIVQQNNPRTNLPEPVLDPKGAFLIKANGNADGDYIIPSIPGFGESTPNWTFAQVTFDTTPFPNAELVFWVVTWMQDGSGNTLSEMPDHGVLQKSFAGQSFRQITDIPLQAHSNNVGIFGSNTPFYVSPAPTGNVPVAGTALLKASVPQRGSQTSLRKTRIDVAQSLILGKKLPFYAIFSAASDFPGSQVRYFDGDPDNGGQLFDLQSVHPLQAGESTAETGYYRPNSCGVHTLYAVTNVEGEPAVVGKGVTKVTLDPLAEIDAMSAALGRSNLASSQQSTLQQVLALARARFAANAIQPALDTLARFGRLLAPSAQDNGSPEEAISQQLQTRSSILSSCEIALHPKLASTVTQTGPTLTSFTPDARVQ